MAQLNRFRFNQMCFKYEKPHKKNSNIIRMSNISQFKLNKIRIGFSRLLFFFYFYFYFLSNSIHFKSLQIIWYIGLHLYGISICFWFNSIQFRQHRTYIYYAELITVYSDILTIVSEKKKNKKQQTHAHMHIHAHICVCRPFRSKTIWDSIPNR